MPICPKCQAPCDEWQHFCLQCGQYLKETPPPFLRCPKCGTGMETVSIIDQESEAPVQWKEAPLGMARSWKWWGGLAAALLGLGLILVWHINHRPSFIPKKMVEITTPSLPEKNIPSRPEKTVPLAEKEVKAPAAEDANLQAAVEGLFADIKEANLKKDMLLFMNTLAHNYPQSDKKRQDVAKTWKKFDFREVAFTTEKLQGVGSDKAIAEVKWTTTCQNLKTKDWRTEEFRYRVWLVNEQGQWKIEKIDQI